MELGIKKVVVLLEQVQKQHVFQFPLEIALVKDGKNTNGTIQMAKRSKSFEIKTKERPNSVVLDSDQWTLLEDMEKL